jgi:L-amino acid N-acyltransferase YncA
MEDWQWDPRREKMRQKRRSDRSSRAVTMDSSHTQRVDAARVRTATPGDADDMASIYNHAVLNSTATFDLEPETLVARRRWRASGATLAALVAEADGSVRGWSSLVRWSARRAYERTVEASVYVAPAAQRSGLGLALGSAALDAARRLELHVVIAQICTENVAGLVLAERLGFERVGVLREVGFKFGRWLDVVVCQRLV